MLSSLSSFLPSALQNINSTSHINPPPEVDDDDDDEERNGNGKVGSGPVTAKKREKKEKGINETFIFVRPPPAKSNHPLNLQVQLVPPNSRAPGVTSSTATPRQSFDGADPATVVSGSPTSSDSNGAPLSRTDSNRSEASTYSASGYTSTASFSSVGSTASGRRMIIPLYNLQAHNVMTNTIVDAGTDAKIAKFTRKGLEMIDLAIIEVVEVWPAPSGITASTTGTGSGRGSLDETHRLRSRLSTVGNSHLRPQQTSSRPTTPDPDRFTPGSSVVSVSSAGLSAADEHPHTDLHIIEAAPAILPIGAPPQKKNIFGKFFKKKDTLPSPDRTPVLPSTSITPASPNSSSQAKTPTQSFIPSSPTRHERHSRSTGAGRRGGSASPSRPMSSAGGEGTGLRGLIKHVRPSSVHLDPSDIHPYDYEFGRETANMSTTSSRLSAASRISNTLEPPLMSNGPSGFSASSATVVLPATLGIQPTLSTPGGLAALSAFSNFASSGYPPPKSLGFGRGPALYVWVIRKWMKTAEGSNSPSLFGGMRHHQSSSGRASGGSQMGFAGIAEIEVRVEWKRGKKSKSKKKKAGGDDTENEGSTSRAVSRSGSQRRRSVAVSESSPLGSNASLPGSETSQARKKRHRLSTTSRASINEDPDTTLTGSLFGRGRKATSAEDDDGHDSDPEDSETPWTCTLKVRRLPVAGLPRPSDTNLKTPVKVKIATLSPTPHHPKVVAMLKVPYPLPDLEVQSMSVRKRSLGPPSTATPNTPQEAPLTGLVLKAEEIKDVVCSTGLWVVVREGFGGVGKVSRKGDGWRIRA